MHYLYHVSYGNRFNMGVHTKQNSEVKWHCECRNTSLSHHECPMNIDSHVSPKETKYKLMGCESAKLELQVIRPSQYSCKHMPVT